MDAIERRGQEPARTAAGAFRARAIQVGIADDHPSGFRNHGAAAFLDLVALAAKIIQPLRTLRGCAWRNGFQSLGRRGRRRQGGCN